jgi:hypothetical protein
LRALGKFAIGPSVILEFDKPQKSRQAATSQQAFIAALKVDV